MPNAFQGEQLVRSLQTPQFRVPTILGWNRLEGRPRTREFDRTLKVQVRDALWMLTRQWQLGEFKGEDAGSPVLTKVNVATTKIDRYKSRTAEVMPYNESLPLESRVEREAIDLEQDLSLRLQMGRYWLRMLRKSINSSNITSLSYESLAAAYKERYPVILPSKPDELPSDHKDAHGEIYAHQEVWRLYAAVVGRSMDGGDFYQHLLNGGNPLDGLSISISDDDVTTIGILATAFQDWFKAQYSQPVSEDDNAWSPSHLEYQFVCSAPQYESNEQDENSGQIVLIADEYSRGHLDWYSFDIHPTMLELEEPQNATPAMPESKTCTFIPAPIEFAGMPNPRWWEFEDRKTDFGDIDAHTTDTAKLLLIEFGLLYANDWFIVPYQLPVGSLAKVRGLAVTDVFGQRVWVDAAGSGADDDWESWSMYHLNQRGEDLPVDTSLFLPPVIGKLLESPPFESVNFIRDEMANMVWGAENQIQLRTGRAQNGYEAAVEFVSYLESLIPPLGSEPSPDVPEPEPNLDEAQIRYQLQTSVPENWIPFIPVRRGNGNNREIQLQRAAMLRTLPNVLDTPKITPRTKLLRLGLEGDSQTPYFLYEEEVPRAGAIVSRTYQRTRWHNGKVYVWQGRRKLTGRGPGASGFEFDLIQPQET